MRYLSLLVVMLLLGCSLLTLTGQAAGAWEVKWSETRPTTDGDVLTIFLASETWNRTNFHYHWGSGPIYENYTNNLQFTATTLVHGDGDTHTLRLYDIDDLAWVTLKGDEVLRVESNGKTAANGTATVTIPDGAHLLRVHWRERCCSASIGLHLPEKLYTPGEKNDNQTPGFGVAAFTCAAVLAIFLSRYGQ